MPPPVPGLWGRRGRSWGARGLGQPGLLGAVLGVRAGQGGRQGGRRLVPAAAEDRGGGTWGVFAVLRLSG